VISVTDNGCGIPESDLDEVFVPFYSTKEEGSGIGLSLSRQIMHLHGGYIYAASKPGKQTTFSLVFHE
jgi:two-component system nitrogen regulation sensor histidine kinase NtrY